MGGCLQSHHVGAFEETRDVLFGCDLRKGRRQGLPFDGVGGSRGPDGSHANKYRKEARSSMQEKACWLWLTTDWEPSVGLL